MIKADRSFAQLQDTTLPQVELEGHVAGGVIEGFAPSHFIQCTLMPHVDDIHSDVSLDARVMIQIPCASGDGKYIDVLCNAKELGNRVYVKGAYIPRRDGDYRGFIKAEVIEVQEYE